MNNLNKSNIICIDINKIEFKKFPGGELHITDSWRSMGNGTLHGGNMVDKVVCRINSSDDFMKLALFTDAYKREFNTMPPRLFMPYIPYARQDRVANSGEALSIKVFAQLLNSLKYSKVCVLDPHSDVSTALIENIEVIPQWVIWNSQFTKWSAEDKINNFDLISPDAGALKKIYKLQECCGNQCDNIRIGTKHRDTKTGQITGTSVDGTPKNKVAIVVDDICDGGRTFIELGKVIKKDYDKIILCITHGIFSNGIEPIANIYDEIYTTNSWNRELQSNNSLHVLKLEDWVF